MILKDAKSSELNWSLDFKPSKPWPAELPVMASQHLGQTVVVAGFDRRQNESVKALTHEMSPLELMEKLWAPDAMAPLERLRFQSVLGKPVPMAFLLAWPLEFQKFLDEKQVPIKSLKPLEYLQDWQSSIIESFRALQPSSSQCREIFDLLCDLKMTGQVWMSCAPTTSDATAWIKSLKTLRYPKTVTADHKIGATLESIPWPRGVHAKLERQGDQAAIVIHAKVANELEWKRLKENLPQIDLGENFWKI